MLRISPYIKITIGLVFLTVSILLLANILGLAPDASSGLLDNRKKFSESLAVQLSTAATKNNMDIIRNTLDVLVQRNEDIHSAALRSAKGMLQVEAGDHTANWTELSDGSSTITHVQVPIFKGQNKWGTVEIRYKDRHSNSWLSSLKKSYWGLILFFIVTGSFAYFMFIRRTFKELNPSAVIPERVKAAFDALAEGVFILDEEGQIVLANDSIIQRVNQPFESLLGMKASRLNWTTSDSDDQEKEYSELPWEKTLRTKQSQTGASLCITNSHDEKLSFMVNCSPILGPKDSLRGVMVTFDDMSALEKKHTELQQTLGNLRESEAILSEQNKELEFLATRDPLTECLNRRSFFERFEYLFREAKKHQTPLCSIMLDIDHFKLVNDRYGHATGDKVIKLVATCLKDNCRPEDVIGRYGGEEFCVVVPGLDIQEASEIAERLRKAIHTGSGIRFTSAMRITASFGISSIQFGAPDPSELINEADRALYAAKESGRNRVIQWTGEGEKQSHALEVDQVDTESDFQETHLNPDEELEQLKKEVVNLNKSLAQRDVDLHQKLAQDELTGLPNRVLFIDRIRQIVNRGGRYNKVAAVLSIELGMFKKVNNTLGHDVGAESVKQIAARLTTALRDADTVSKIDSASIIPSLSRIDSDEFGILLTDLSSSDDVAWVIKRIIDSISKRITVGDHDIFLNSHIGVSLFPHDAETPEDLLHNAGMARQHAKQQLGRNTFQFYSNEINTTASHCLKLESMLHRAVEAGEFLLHYQPKLDLKTGKITSLEALLRWDSPEKGMISPIDFIPIAERSGLINQLGEWVIRTSCFQVKAWHDAGFHDISVAVNLSSVQFRDKMLPTRIFKMIEEAGIDAKDIEFELTESAIMENVDTSVQIMQQLHDAGSKLAIDDFGTGYSSLNHLKRFPIDQLKIDKSFLTDIPGDSHDEAIIKAIIAMARSMDLTIVAEGVEEEHQLAFLRDQGCHEIQGYLFSRPVPAEKATELLQQNKLQPALAATTPAAANDQAIDDLVSIKQSS